MPELITNGILYLLKGLSFGSRETVGGEQEDEMESRMGVWGMNTLIMTDSKLTDMMTDLNLVNLKADSAGVTMTGESRGQHL